MFTATNMIINLINNILRISNIFDKSCILKFCQNARKSLKHTNVSPGIPTWSPRLVSPSIPSRFQPGLPSVPAQSPLVFLPGLAWWSYPVSPVFPPSLMKGWHWWVDCWLSAENCICLCKIVYTHVLSRKDNVWFNLWPISKFYTCFNMRRTERTHYEKAHFSSQFRFPIKDKNLLD